MVQFCQFNKMLPNFTKLLFVVILTFESCKTECILYISARAFQRIWFMFLIFVYIGNIMSSPFPISFLVKIHHSKKCLIAKISFDTAENEPRKVCTLFMNRSPRKASYRLNTYPVARRGCVENSAGGASACRGRWRSWTRKVLLCEVFADVCRSRRWEIGEYFWTESSCFENTFNFGRIHKRKSEER